MDEQRLREIEHQANSGWYDYSPQSGPHRIDGARLDALTLITEVRRAREINKGLVTSYHNSEDRARRLQAENARLREAAISAQNYLLEGMPKAALGELRGVLENDD